MITKSEIAKVLEEIAFLLALKGENPFKVKAYSKAARIIRNLPEQPAALAEKGALTEIQGIGPTLAGTITELITSGSSRLHQELRAPYPSTVLENLLKLAEVPGLGPQHVGLIYERLGVATVGELQYAGVENRLAELPGFGKKTQEKILAGIQRFQRHQGNRLYADVIGEAEELLLALRAVPGVQRAEFAGALRRKNELVQNFSFVLAGEESLHERVCSVPGLQRLVVEKSGTASAVSVQGLPVEFNIVPEQNYGWELFAATGNPQHVEAVTQRLTSQESFDTEQAVYAAAGLSWVPPEMREGYGEVELAMAGQLPSLVETSQVQGIFHNHTVYTDGSATVEQMARAAQALGYRYIGISDHSQSAYYVHGLKEDRIIAQREEIEVVQAKLPGIRIFKGIEADILADGSMDYPDDILASFDFVIASVHSRFNLSEEDQTRRLCRALTNPYVTMLGHATGRLLLSRDGYRVDMRKIIDTAAEQDKLIEINASRHRLELDWRWCRYAKEQGVKFSINPDAHSTEELRNIPWGINVARKGGLTATEVINTLPVGKMAAYLQARRPNLVL